MGIEAVPVDVEVEVERFEHILAVPVLRRDRSGRLLTNCGATIIGR